jgi:single-strand DNA-binding protein
MNTVHLVGTLKSEPKMKSFASGSAKTTALVSAQAPGRQYPDTIDVAAWDDQAMVLADMKQGQAVEIHGRVTTESWDDKASGQKRYKMLVIAETVATPARTVLQAMMVQRGVQRQTTTEEVPF